MPDWRHLEVAVVKAPPVERVLQDGLWQTRGRRPVHEDAARDDVDGVQPAVRGKRGRKTLRCMSVNGLLLPECHPLRIYIIYHNGGGGDCES